MVTKAADVPAGGELARTIDAMNAIPTADGSPRVIVQGFDAVNGQGDEEIDIPGFLSGE